MFDGVKRRLAEWSLKSIQMDSRFIEAITDKNPKWTNWTAENAVREGYKQSLWVYAAINKKAKAAASVPWYVYRKNRSGEYEQIKDHPLQILIDKPNPFMSRNNMIEKLIMQLDLAGNSLFSMAIVGGVPVELWNIGPDGIKPKPDPREFIKEYEWRLKTGPVYNIPANEIVHLMYIDPSQPYWGIAPLQVAARTVDTDTEAVIWNKIALQNRAVTDGVFTVNQPLTTPQYNDLRAQVTQQHQGARNARAPWVLGAGATWQQMSLSPTEMDFIESRKMTREEIAAIFQVPPPLLGILDKANYSNMKEARRVFWLDTIIPLLDDLKETFNRALTPYFGQDIELDYDITNVEALAENVNEKIDGATKLFAMGVPFNTISQRLDLGIDEIEGGDTGYLAGGLMPANMAGLIGRAASEAENGEPPEAPGSDPGSAPGSNPGSNPEDDEDEDDPGEKSGPGPTALKAFRLKNPEQKAYYWKSFERQRASWYAKMQTEAEKLFEDERKRVVKAYQDSGELSKALAAVDKEKWTQLYYKNYLAVYEDFGRLTFDGFKSYFPSETKAFSWNPFDSVILNYLFMRAAKKVTYVTDYTKELVKGIIYTGRDRNDSIGTIAKDLDKSFEEFSTHRSYRIARTEVVSASNYGSYQAAKQAESGVGKMTKEWVDSGDPRVRDSHEKVNGEVVGMEEAFSNGLEYPGDMKGPAKEVIHCRCTLIYNPLDY